MTKLKLGIVSLLAVGSILLVGVGANCTAPCEIQITCTGTYAGTLAQTTGALSGFYAYVRQDGQLFDTKVNLTRVGSTNTYSCTVSLNPNNFPASNNPKFEVYATYYSPHDANFYVLPVLKGSVPLRSGTKILKSIDFNDLLNANDGVTPVYCLPAQTQ